MSNAAHPGLCKTNLQISGPSHGRAKPTALARFYQFSWRYMPFMWQEVDEGILPVLYAAADPHARGGVFYGPTGFYEMAGGGVAEAKVLPARRIRKPAAGCGPCPNGSPGSVIPTMRTGRLPSPADDKGGRHVP